MTRADLGRVRLHDDATSWRVNGGLGTAAVATGRDIFFRRGALNPGSGAGAALLEHELHHIARPDGTPSASHVQAAVIDDERVRVTGERQYRESADLLERKLGTHLTKMPAVHAIADDMLARLRTIVDAWAEATKTGKEKVYANEFTFESGKEYYGSFQLTGKEIKRVFDKPSQPLRKKLNLIYYAVRNGNFTKYLDAAANELRLLNTGKTGAQTVTSVNNKVERQEAVRLGFAAKSGLAAMWQTDAKPVKGESSKDEVVDDVAKRVKAAERAKQPAQFGGFTKALGMGDANKRLRGDKNYGSYAGLGLEDTETLTRGDVDDITTAEMRLLYERAGKKQPAWLSHRDKEKFMRDGATKVLWEQGGANIEVASASETRRIADETISRLEGGISGSTDLMMHASKHLGYTTADELKGIRLALVAWMLSNRDHSFFEIMTVAADYGVPFHLDQAHPGSEYEHLDNFYPLPQPTIFNFRKLLPNDRMPAYYLSDANKGTIDGGLPQKATSSSDFVDELVGQGLALDASWKTDPKAGDLAQWLALRTAVQGLAIKTGRTEPALRANRVEVQRVLKDPAWQHVVKASVDVNARANLRALIRDEHGADAVVEDADLVAAAVPATLFDGKEEYKRYDALRMYALVCAEQPNMGASGSRQHAEAVDRLTKSTTYAGLKAWLGSKSAQLALSAMLVKVLGVPATTAREQDQAATLPTFATYKATHPKLTDSEAHIRSLGVPSSWLAWITQKSKVDPYYMHYLIDEYAKKVATAGFKRKQAPGSPANLAARNTLESSGEHTKLAGALDKFIGEISGYLIEHALGARALTAAEHEKSFAGKRPAEQIDELTALGVPREAAETAPETALMLLHRVRRAVLESTFDRTKTADRTVNRKAWTNLIGGTAVKALQATNPFKNLAEPIAAVMVRDLIASTVLEERQLLLAAGTDQRIAHSDKIRLGKTQVMDTTTLSTPAMSGEAPATNARQTADRDERYWATDASQKDFTKNIGGVSPTVQAQLGVYRAKLLSDDVERHKAMDDLAASAEANQGADIDPKQTVAELKDDLFGALTPAEQVDAIVGYLTPQQLLSHVDADTKAAIDAIAALSPRERGALYQYTNKLHDEMGYATQSFTTSDDFTVADITSTTKKLRSLKFMLPVVQALHSALEQLPPYKGGNLYSGRSSGSSKKLTLMTDAERLAFAARHFKVGSIIDYAYPLSTAKDIDASYIVRPGTDVCLEIQPPFLTGKDIEYLSNKVNEKEVLFPQGVRFKVVSVSAQPPGNQRADTKDKLWVVVTEV